MTKKHVDKEAALPIRNRSNDSGIDSEMYVLLEQVTPDSSTNVPILMHDYAHMHQFGHETNPPFFSSRWNILLPSTTPTLQFPAPEDTPEDELPQPHLFYSHISAELNAEGVRFEGYVDPFMHDVFLDENGQPQMIAAGAGKYMAHFWRIVLMTRTAEPDRVPVYPRRSPSNFNSSPPQAWPSNPFGVQQGSVRPVPSQRRKLPRSILPKGSRMPPAAAVEILETENPVPTRGRKRALSPDSRAAAREVRVMHACARCHTKREKVSSGPRS